MWTFRVPRIVAGVGIQKQTLSYRPESSKVVA